MWRGVSTRLGRRFSFHVKFGLSADAEVIIGAPGGFHVASFHQHFPVVMQQAGFVLHIPTQSLEKRRDEVHARLGLKIVLGRIVLLVGFKLANELFKVRVKGGNGQLARVGSCC